MLENIILLVITTAPLGREAQCLFLLPSPARVHNSTRLCPNVHPLTPPLGFPECQVRGGSWSSGCRQAGNKWKGGGGGGGGGKRLYSDANLLSTYHALGFHHHWNFGLSYSGASSSHELTVSAQQLPVPLVDWNPLPPLQLHTDIIPPQRRGVIHDRCSSS